MSSNRRCGLERLPSPGTRRRRGLGCTPIPPLTDHCYPMQFRQGMRRPSAAGCASSTRRQAQSPGSARAAPPQFSLRGTASCRGGRGYPPRRAPPWPRTRSGIEKRSEILEPWREVGAGKRMRQWHTRTRKLRQGQASMLFMIMAMQHALPPVSPFTPPFRDVQRYRNGLCAGGAQTGTGKMASSGSKDRRSPCSPRRRSGHCCRGRIGAVANAWPPP